MASPRVVRTRHRAALEDQAPSGVRGRATGKDRNVSAHFPKVITALSPAAAERPNAGRRSPNAKFLCLKTPRGILGVVVSVRRCMEKETLDLLDAALEAVRGDLVPRVEELAQKSSAGTLTPEEQGEYAEIVRLNDTLSVLKLQTEDLSAVRAAS